ncbi:TPA: putative phage replication protein, partial [Acinetobacter nosocomialis]|nr:putative phage replication protein [Acinetobacter nosocomialis]
MNKFEILAWGLLIS